MVNAPHIENSAAENPEDDPLLRPRRVAVMLDLNEDTLANWRALYGQTRLPFIKLNEKDVRYRRSVVLAFIRERESTTPERMARKSGGKASSNEARTASTSSIRAPGGRKAAA